MMSELEDFICNEECRSEEEFNEKMKFPSDDHEIDINDVDFGLTNHPTPDPTKPIEPGKILNLSGYLVEVVESCNCNKCPFDTGPSCRVFKMGRCVHFLKSGSGLVLKLLHDTRTPEERTMRG